LSKAINETLLVFPNFFTVNAHTQTGQRDKLTCMLTRQRTTY